MQSPTSQVDGEAFGTKADPSELLGRALDDVGLLDVWDEADAAGDRSESAVLFAPMSVLTSQITKTIKAISTTPAPTKIQSLVLLF
ncbi:hypothetical protein [Renibacterium salmoninarum]|uniref:hypothetical protein n=1 Tax=Renibacterium salmoninarum TaxID=1646 RepID=UPI00031D719F|nr:hypothetical protein [Renibacterium salmoninarum]